MKARILIAVVLGLIPRAQGAKRPTIVDFDISIDRTLCAISDAGKILCVDAASSRKDQPWDGDLESPIPGKKFKMIRFRPVQGDEFCVLTTDNEVYCSRFVMEEEGRYERRVLRVLFPEDFRVRKIEMGYLDFCALSDKGKVICWNHGEEFPEERDNPFSGSLLFGPEKCDYCTFFHKAWAPVGFRSTDLSVRNGSACVTYRNGWVNCWGINTFPVNSSVRYDYHPMDFGKNFKASQVLSMGIVGYACALSRPEEARQGEVRCVYGNPYSKAYKKEKVLRTIPLGKDFNPRRILALGANSICALDLEGRAKCWGKNEAGQLGTGDQIDNGDFSQPQREVPDLNLGLHQKIQLIQGNDEGACALLRNGQVKCWGFEFIGIDPPEMGDDLPFIDFGTE